MTNRFPNPYTKEAGKKFVEFAVNAKLKKKPLLKFIEIESKFSGALGLYPQEDIFELNAEFAYWHAEKHWGKGIIISAIEEMVNYGFKEFEWNRIYSRVAGSNIKSQNVLLKAGFTLENRKKDGMIKLNKLDDCLVFGMRKSKSNIS